MRDELLLTSPIESTEAIDLFRVAGDRSLFSDNVIEFGGEKFTPDETKGYFRFTVSTAFPSGSTVYGTALYSGVIGKSFRSLYHQGLNWEHQVAAYYKKPGQPNSVDDRYIGQIVAVDFPNGGMWRMNSNSAPPAISGVAVYNKLSQGMSRIIGDHQTGRHNYTVSMEVNYYAEKSGFAVSRSTGGKGETFQSTPDDFSSAGYDYVPWADASEGLRATFSRDKNRIISKYKTRDVFLLMGGLDGSVHYGGLGLVKYGAERTAKINRMTASAAGMAQPFEELGEAFESLTASLKR